MRGRCLLSVLISTGRRGNRLATSRAVRSAIELRFVDRRKLIGRNGLREEMTMTTVPNRLERRGAQRFEVHLPLAVHFAGRTVPGFTQDLSGRGVFFYAETTLPEGAIVELTFTMPSEITLGESMPVRCQGRVLRASASPSGERSGIAVRLDSYQYLSSGESISHFVRVSAAGAGAAASGAGPR